MSRKHGGEKYVKSFDGYTHLLTMLYAVIQRFDSLREIETSMTAEVRKLHHVGIDTVPKRSRSEEHTSELQSPWPVHLVCRLLLEIGRAHV